MNNNLNTNLITSKINSNIKKLKDLPGVIKKKNKSTHGKKNWKKIDVSDIEKSERILNKEKYAKIEIEKLKDDQLFTVDIQPKGGKKNLLLNKKTKRKPEKKVSKVEQRIIERIITNQQFTDKEEKPVSKPTSLWDDETKINIGANKNKQSTIKLSYPKVPLPHPGQSYNPSKDDLTKLITKVVELNKPIVPSDPITTEVQEMEFISDEEEEIEPELAEKIKISNNPPVDDFTQRKTRKEKKLAQKKKMNILKDKELIAKKKNKSQLAQEKSLKRIVKEKQKKINEEEVIQKEEKKINKSKEMLIKNGIVEE
jgi:nucleolar protein 53